MTEDPTELTEFEISNHSLLLRGLNKKVPIKKAQEVMENIFSHVLGDNLIKVHVVGDYMKMLYYLQKLSLTEKK